MDKLWLIIKREYLSRVKKRSFILTTLITPLAILFFIVVVAFIFSYEGDDTKKIAVVDEHEILTIKKGNDVLRRIGDRQNANTRIYFKFPNKPLTELIDQFDKNDYDGILVLPSLTNLKAKNYELFYYADEQLNLETSFVIEQMLTRGVRDYKIDQFGFKKRRFKKPGHEGEN